MEAAAEQRKLRMARQTEHDPPQELQGSAVFLVRDGNSQAEMVKVPVKNLKEHEVRALFEVMVSNTVKNADEIR